MALLKFLVKKNNGDTLQLPSVSLCTSTTLSEKDIRSANESVLKKLEVKKPTLVTRKMPTKEKHNGYTPEQRAQIAKYAAGITYCNHVYAHDVITIGHDQTAKFHFANILVSRLSDKIAKFFARQYFYHLSNLHTWMN